MWAEGELWKRNRRHFVHFKQSPAYTPENVELTIRTEIDYLMNLLQSSRDGPVDLQPHILAVTYNTTSKLFLGRSYKHDDTELHRVLNLIRETFDCFQSVPALIPILRHLPGDAFGVKRTDDVTDQLLAYADRLIQERKCEMTEDKQPTDVITMYLRQIKAESYENCRGQDVGDGALLSGKINMLL